MRDTAYAGGVIEAARVFVDAVDEALPSFVAARLAALGEDPGDHRRVVTDACAAAVDALATLVEAPFDRQADTPLETLRRELAVLDEALAERGVIPLPDDPGGSFGLAPVSAADLGAQVLEASLGWGLAKTEALSRPLALVVTANLMDSSRLEGAVTRAGYRLESRRDPHPSTTPLVAFVDLETDGADAIIRELAGRRVRVIAYGPHVDDLAMVRAMALGAERAEPRSRLFRNPSEFLRPLV